MSKDKLLFVASEVYPFTKSGGLADTVHHYNKIIKHNMFCDFSWQESTESYFKLYETIKEDRSHG